MRYFLIILIIAVWSCDKMTPHADDCTLSVHKVKLHCDFDISKTKFEIREMNNGKLVLVYRKYSAKVKTMGGAYVTGNDTCYLKKRAYHFWLNSIKD